MTQTPRRSRATEAFFGRRHGKTLRPRAAAATEAGLALYRLDLSKPALMPIGTLFAPPRSRVVLEIGFGGGEHLMHAAAREPDAGFIGVEPFVNGMAKLMQALEAAPRDNIRVHDDDATVLLDWLPEASLDRIDLFYPDPWPKKKHWKRRFVSPANLERFARVLKKGGSFRFASDIASYVDWTLLACRAHPAFEWTTREPADWQKPFPDWPGTRYEAKAVAAGRRPTYLTFLRT